MDPAELERRLNALTDEDKKNLRRFFQKRLPDTESPNEAAGETLARAFEGAAKLETDAAFWGWFWGIARNVAREMRKAARKRNERFSLAGEAFGEEATEPEGREEAAPEIVEQSERDANLRGVLSSLTEDEQKAMAFKLYNGLKQTEIAEALGWTLAKVKNTLRSGYEKLRGKLDDLDR